MIIQKQNGVDRDHDDTRLRILRVPDLVSFVALNILCRIDLSNIGKIPARQEPDKRG